MKYPVGISSKQKKRLKKVYIKSLRENSKKVEPEKAKNISKAKFYEESFKIFMKLEENKKNRVKFKIKKSYIKEGIDYKVYKINGTKMAVSTDKKILDKFKTAERKGLLREMDDPYEQEILFKIKDKYQIEFDPDMFYAIK